MPITTALRYYIADLTCATNAGIDTTYMRKSNDNTLVCFQDTVVTAYQLMLCQMYHSMHGKMVMPFDESDFRMLIDTDANWVGTEEPTPPGE